MPRIRPFCGCHSLGRSLVSLESGVLTLAIALPLLLLAAGEAQTTGTTGEGETIGGYTVHQSVEFGGHIVEQTGSDSMYSTLVDIHSGPRLLEQSLSMQSQNHEGVLFDNLYLNSFG